MASDWAAKFYESVHWKKTRESFRQYKRGLCEECLKQGIVRAGTEVHHIIPLTISNVHNPNISLSWKNLELLCTDCHHAIHEAMHDAQPKERKHRRYIVDAEGNIKTRDDSRILRDDQGKFVRENVKRG